jgi:U1 small nuclear ribonucleoprotein C
MLQPSVRKQHNAGFKHKANVRAYYLQFEQQETEDMLEKKMAANMALAMRPGFGAPAVLPGTPALPRAGLVRPHIGGGMGGGMPPVNMPPAGLAPPLAGLRPPPHAAPPPGMGMPPPGMGDPHLALPGPPSAHHTLPHRLI